GGWTLEAEQAATGLDDEETLELVMLLRDSSLIGVVDTPDGLRFTLLETVREYAAERLERSGELGAVRGRHAGYFLALAETAVPQLMGSEQAVWLDRLETEHENMRIALDWLLTAGVGGMPASPAPNAQASAPAWLALRLAGALRPFWEVRGYLREGRAYL